MKTKRLITSALPYVNNIPHLGNLIQVLSADVFARFCRSSGYVTLYICGTDEYGTATETRALEEGITPKELCDRYYKIHSDIYEWFGISFDKFGRTSTPEQTEITQGIFLKLDEAGYIKEQTLNQLYSEKSNMFLADRYVRGTCPHCSYEEARGDQCENCGKLLDPQELINPKSSIDDSIPVLKETKHLYIDLPGILPHLQKWIDDNAEHGAWARNAVQMTKSWIRDGLRERCITRDLKWGIPVPKAGFENKVFYVWFDAPIGYISITATHTEDWESWWKNPDEVQLFQFIGKDNIPFHTVIFPSSLLGSGENWTLLHTMSSSEYLNYEGGKFSKSKGVGVFGTDVQQTGIPADVWRFYMYYNRPETSDYLFTWSDFQEKVNGELIGNLGNLVNRTLTFANRYFEGRLGEGPSNAALWQQIRESEKEITADLEKANLRDGIRKIFALSSLGNKAFQDGEPWKSRISDPDAAKALITDLAFLIKDLSILIEPYLPSAAAHISAFLGAELGAWNELGGSGRIGIIEKPEILFERLEDDLISSLRERFAGTQDEREEKRAEQEAPVINDEARFDELIDLRVARITAVDRHPDADKLYVEKISIGNEERTIVSGLVGHYEEHELVGKNIILAYNLKPAKLRGVVSEGMLLAADKDDVVEVIFLDNAEPGDRVVLKGSQVPEDDKKIIKVDTFFDVPIKVVDHRVTVGSTVLQCNGSDVITKTIAEGSVG